MYLVIGEKPSVAQTLAKVLGAKKRQEGYLEGNGWLVSWCLGHLAEYAAPEEYDEKYRKWEFSDLPILPEKWRLTVAKEKKSQFVVLKNLLNRTDVEYVVNGCDAGREGELIFRRVYELSGSRIPVKRIWISSMEDCAIREGFANLKDGAEYQNLYDASVCRAKADWLIGMNATRAFTTKYFKRLVVGRVQTPTLAMLVERGEQIRGFQKEKYFNVELDCDGMKAEKQKIFDPEEAERIYNACNGSNAVVHSVETIEKKVKPPKLYDLTSLQREANRIYGMTAQQTLHAAQSLYEDKLITYPRTDSNYLTEDMEPTAKTVFRIIHEKYQPSGPFDQPGMPDTKRVLNNKKVSDHHAIIPTAELLEANLAGLKEPEQKILFLISIHTVEAMEKEHIYLETSVEVGCGEEIFHAKGKNVLQNGWKIYEECVKNKDGFAIEDPDEAGKDRIPDVKQGDVFLHVKSRKTEHFTSPPKNYTEDTLLSAMETAGNKEFDSDTEKKGLGTPATRASIIEKLVSSGYAVRKGKQLMATQDGADLISVLPDYLKSASMTAEWENRLLRMEKGELAGKDFLQGIVEVIDQMLLECGEISVEEQNRFYPRETVGLCPVCGSPVFEGKQNFFCANRDCSFALWKENRYLASIGKQMDKTMAAELLNKGKIYASDFYSQKKKRKFAAYLLMDVIDGKVSFELEFPKKKSSKR